MSTSSSSETLTPMAIHYPHLMSSLLETHVGQKQWKRNQKDLDWLIPFAQLRCPIVVLSRQCFIQAFNTPAVVQKRLDLIQTVKYPFWDAMRLVAQLLIRVRVRHHLPFQQILTALEEYVSAQECAKSMFHTQDVWIVQELRAEWNLYRSLLMDTKSITGIHLQVQIQLYLNTVAWNELCDTREIQLERTKPGCAANRLRQCTLCAAIALDPKSKQALGGAVGPWYPNTLWDAVVSESQAELRRNDLCLPLLGIWYGQSNQSMVERYMVALPSSSTTTQSSSPLPPPPPTLDPNRVFFIVPSAAPITELLQAKSVELQSNVLPILGAMDHLYTLKTIHQGMEPILTRMAQTSSLAKLKGQCAYTFLFRSLGATSFLTEEALQSWHSDHWFSLFTLANQRSVSSSSSLLKERYQEVELSVLEFADPILERTLVAKWMEKGGGGGGGTSSPTCSSPTQYYKYIQSLHQSHTRNPEFMQQCEEELEETLERLVMQFLPAFLNYAWYYECEEWRRWNKAFHGCLARPGHDLAAMEGDETHKAWVKNTAELDQKLLAWKKTVQGTMKNKLDSILAAFQNYMFQQTCFYLWQGLVMFESDPAFQKNVPLLYCREMLIRLQNGVAEKIVLLFQMVLSGSSLGMNDDVADSNNVEELIRAGLTWPGGVSSSQWLEQWTSYKSWLESRFHQTGTQRLETCLGGSFRFDVKESVPKLNWTRWVAWCLRESDQAPVVRTLLKQYRDVWSPIPHTLQSKTRTLIEQWCESNKLKSNYSPWVKRWIYFLSLYWIDDENNNKGCVDEEDGEKNSSLHVLVYFLIVELFARLQSEFAR